MSGSRGWKYPKAQKKYIGKWLQFKMFKLLMYPKNLQNVLEFDNILKDSEPSKKL